MMSECTSSVGLESPEARRGRWRRLAVCLALAALVWAVFGQTRYFDFINFDDPAYIINNPMVNQGFSWDRLAWMFTHWGFHEWFPVTYLTWMLDVQWFGLSSGGMHGVNVGLHGVAAVLLFLLLEKMTGACWRSAFAAALFAVHPLRAESVAWVVERKDVLSGCFFMLTLWSWLDYTRRPPGRRRWGDYALALAWFVLGLMSKSVLVTMPAVLLLLDFWLLHRVPSGGLRGNLKPWLGLLLEKAPFAVLGAAATLTTMLTESNVMLSTHLHSLYWRMGNVALGYWSYLWHSVYPAGLALGYTYDNENPALATVVACLLPLALISAAAVLTWRKHPCLIVGWGWFVIMLLPTIDTMAGTHNTRADRYCYLAQVGLCLMAGWGAAALAQCWRLSRAVPALVAVAVLGALAVAAHRQTGYWKDSVTLWTHTLACTRHNAFAENNLGSALVNRGESAAAIPHFERALAYKPDHVQARINLGIALANQGKREEAIQQLKAALEWNPQADEACYQLGRLLLDEGNLAEAMHYEQRALELKPDYSEAHYTLGLALADKERWDDAMAHYGQALHQKVDHTDAQYITAIALAAHEQWDKAVALYGEVLRAKPDFPEAHYRLGLALAGEGNATGAMAELQKALALAGDNAALAEKVRAQLRKPGATNAPAERSHQTAR